jgi:hypothetical protein
MPSNEPASESTAENTTSSAEPSIFERLVAAQRLLDKANKAIELAEVVVSSLKAAAEIELSSLGLKTVKLADGSSVKVTSFTKWNIKPDTKTEFIRLAIKEFSDIVSVNPNTADSFVKNAEPEVRERIEKYFSKFEGKKVGVSVCG